MRTIALLCLLFPSLLHAESYWQQHVAYTINASLNPKTHEITGTVVLDYRNNSPDTLNVVYFRLYWNLFTEGSEGQRYNHQNKYYYHDTSGGISVSDVAVKQQGATGSPTYSIDNTLMTIELPRPLFPGASATFSMGFRERVPRGGNRTGHSGRDYDIAQWYPQIATYDKFGWDKSQYLGPAEFHNEFGIFDVEITLPKSFTIAHSGVLLNPEEVYPDSVLQKLNAARDSGDVVRVADYTSTDWKGQDTLLSTWKFHAENVRDFAWSANEHYIWDVTRWSPGEGHPDIRIHSMYFKGLSQYWKEAASYGKHAISFFSRHFGLYAYPNMFIVEGSTGGGMEYPGITFIGHYGDKHTHGLFGVITHETGHNWYPMFMSSNETHYGFMDEGFTTFLTALAVEDFYGRYDNKYEWTTGLQKFLRYANDTEREAIQRSALSLSKNGFEVPIATHIYRTPEPALVGDAIYSKTASVMFMLQYVMGDSTFEVFMKEYYNRWKFKHPYPEDFYSLAQEMSGKRNLQWFFDQWIHRTSRCDYAVCGLKSREEGEGPSRRFMTDFTIRKLEHAIMPLDVRLTMDDGSDTTVWIPVEEWMNGEEEYRGSVALPRRVSKAEINPDGRILDINRLNNATGLPAAEFRLDNTLFKVIPVDRYLVTGRPSLWYTDEGGWNVGYKVAGDYLNDMYRFSLGNWYNTREQTVDYDLTAGNNLFRISPLTDADVRLYQLEGRRGATLSAQKTFRKTFSKPGSHHLSLVYSYSRLMNREYLLRPNTWEDGNLQRMIAGYSYWNRWKMWDLSASLFVEGSSSLLGRSDFQYSKRTIEVRSRIQLPSSIRLGLRLYQGAGYGNIPMQVRYYADQSSPLEQFSNPLLRSKGVIPSTARDHALASGGGNMRGYFRHAIARDKIDALTAEMRFPTMIPFMNLRLPVLHRVMREFSGVLFVDAGRLSPGSTDLWKERFELDCGFGFRLNSVTKWFGPFSGSSMFSAAGLQSIQIDFPIYVSMPLPNEEKFKFRWVIRFSETI